MAKSLGRTQQRVTLQSNQINAYRERNKEQVKAMVNAWRETKQR
jgi:hypothetical protein